jgi:Actinobacteria/chloroflexi VLRF1 release factor
VTSRHARPFGRQRAPVCGCDRRAVDALRADQRLGPLFALETAPFLTVPDPRLTVLRQTPSRFRAVRIRLVEPPP